MSGMNNLTQIRLRKIFLNLNYWRLKNGSGIEHSSPLSIKILLVRQGLFLHMSSVLGSYDMSQRLLNNLTAIKIVRTLLLCSFTAGSLLKKFPGVGQSNPTSLKEVRMRFIDYVHPGKLEMNVQ